MLRAKAIPSLRQACQRCAVGFDNDNDFGTLRPITAWCVNSCQVDRAGAEVSPVFIKVERRKGRRPTEIDFRFRLPADHFGEKDVARQLRLLTPSLCQKGPRRAETDQLDLEIKRTKSIRRAHTGPHGAIRNPDNPNTSARNGARSEPVDDLSIARPKSKNRPHRIVPKTGPIDDLDKSTGL